MTTTGGRQVQFQLWQGPCARIGQPPPLVVHLELPVSSRRVKETLSFGKYMTEIGSLGGTQRGCVLLTILTIERI